jgi:hypothetical protein
MNKASHQHQMKEAAPVEKPQGFGMIDGDARSS